MARFKGGLQLKIKLLRYKESAAAAVAILLVGVFLRTYNIFSIPIFADEAIYIRWSQVMKAVSTLRFLPLSDGKQPLFMWITIPFIKVFEDPLIAGRMVSVVSGIASVVGIFLLTFLLFKSRKTALLASFFYAVSPFAVFFDRMALVDSMLSMFGIWSVFFAVLTAKFLRLDTAMLTGFSLGGAWLTKSPAVFFILLLPLTMLLAPLPKKLISLKLLQILCLWMVSLAIAFGMYNILRLGPEFHMIWLRNQDYVFPLSHAWTNPWDPFQFHIKEIIEWFWVLVPGSVLLAALAAIFVGLKKYWREYCLLLAWSIFPLLVQAELAKVFTARYLLFTTPPIFIFAALALTQFFKLKPLTYWLLVALAAAPGLWINYLLLTTPEKAPLPRVERSGYLEVWTAGTGIREIAQLIKGQKNVEPTKNITVGTEGYFGTLPDGLQIYLADIPGIVVKGVGVTITSVDSSLIQAKRAGDKVYLVVNSSRFEGSAGGLGLKLLASYPKAIQPSGKQESLLLFEVNQDAISIFDVKNAKGNKK